VEVIKNIKRNPEGCEWAQMVAPQTMIWPWLQSRHEINPEHHHCKADSCLSRTHSLIFVDDGPSYIGGMPSRSKVALNSASNCSSVLPSASATCRAYLRRTRHTAHGTRQTL